MSAMMRISEHDISDRWYPFCYFIIIMIFINLTLATIMMLCMNPPTNNNRSNVDESIEEQTPLLEEGAAH